MSVAGAWRQVQDAERQERLEEQPLDLASYEVIGGLGKSGFSGVVGTKKGLKALKNTFNMKE